MPTDALELLDLDPAWSDAAAMTLAALQSGDARARTTGIATLTAIAERLPAADPRRAATASNRALAALLAGEKAAALAAADLASQLWLDAQDWVARMHVPDRAGSTTFHMRMRQRHAARYDADLRARYVLALEAGRAVSGVIAVLARAALGDIATARAQCAAAAAQRARAVAPGDALLEQLAAALGADAPGASGPWLLAAEAVQRTGWTVDLPPVYTDHGRLLAAVCGTVAPDGARIEALTRFASFTS